jgi:hypothetical protein
MLAPPVGGGGRNVAGASVVGVAGTVVVVVVGRVVLVVLDVLVVLVVEGAVGPGAGRKTGSASPSGRVLLVVVTNGGRLVEVVDVVVGTVVLVVDVVDDVVVEEVVVEDVVVEDGMVDEVVVVDVDVVDVDVVVDVVVVDVVVVDVVVVDVVVVDVVVVDVEVVDVEVVEVDVEVVVDEVVEVEDVVVDGSVVEDVDVVDDELVVVVTLEGIVVVVVDGVVVVVVTLDGLVVVVDGTVVMVTVGELVVVIGGSCPCTPFGGRFSPMTTITAATTGPRMRRCAYLTPEPQRLPEGVRPGWRLPCLRTRPPRSPNLSRGRRYQPGPAETGVARGGQRQCWTVPSAQPGEALGGVGQLGVDRNHPGEELTGPGGVADPFVQVGQGVPEAEVVRLGGPAGRDRAALQQGDRLPQVAPVGEGSGHHDPSLGHQVRPRRGPAQLVPQRFDVPRLAQGSVRVSQHRVLLHRTGQAYECLQVGRGLGPASQPVKREPGQLPDGADVGRLFDQWTEDAPRLLEPVPFEGPRRVDKEPLDPGRPTLPHGLGDLGHHRRRRFPAGRSPGSGRLRLGTARVGLVLPHPHVRLPRGRSPSFRYIPAGTGPLLLCRSAHLARAPPGNTAPPRPVNRFRRRRPRRLPLPRRAVLPAPSSLGTAAPLPGRDPLFPPRPRTPPRSPPVDRLGGRPATARIRGLAPSDARALPARLTGLNIPLRSPGSRRTAPAGARPGGTS